MFKFIEREPESLFTSLQEEELYGCLADGVTEKFTTYMYTSTGSDLVSPTMISTSRL